LNAPNPVRIVLTHPAGWIASGFGVGLSPRAAGTVGSLAALLPWWFFLRHLSWPLYLGCLLVAFAIGVWAANWVIAKTRIEDPSVVVCDEFVGLWIALLLAPEGWPWMAGGFALFRLFDIWKPWPVSWADQKLHGGFGAMFDDVIAGIYALLVLQLAAYYAPSIL
jgi:phosphatidylglycerophosphatase A